MQSISSNALAKDGSRLLVPLVVQFRKGERKPCGAKRVTRHRLGLRCCKASWAEGELQPKP